MKAFRRPKTKDVYRMKNKSEQIHGLPQESSSALSKQGEKG